MRIRQWLVLVASHIAVGGLGFAAGIYLLPVLVAPPAPTEAEVRGAAAQATYKARFDRDRKGSDALHWGEGEVAISNTHISLMGRLAPGPDYKLYLSPEFVETAEEFNRLKPDMIRLGDIRTFKNFLLEMPAGVDLAQYNSVIVWCESFGQFITSARYR